MFWKVQSVVNIEKIPHREKVVKDTRDWYLATFDSVKIGMK